MSDSEPLRSRFAVPLMTAVGVGLFAVTAWVASWGLSDAEWAVFEVFNDVPTPWSWFLVAADPLGSGLAAVVVPFAVFALFRQVEVTLVAGLAGPIAWMSAQVGKALQIRGRPVDLIEEFLPAGDATGAGFPSGHTAVATAFAVVLWPYVPGWCRPILAAVAVTVALARMHLGVHLPLDLAGGVAVGLVVGTLALLLVSRRG